MEAAYGLALTITMLSTSIMLWFYLARVNKHLVIATVLYSALIVLDGFFFITNLMKFMEGGYVAVVIACLVAGAFWICAHGSKLEHQHRKHVHALRRGQIIEGGRAGEGPEGALRDASKRTLQRASSGIQPGCIGWSPSRSRISRTTTAGRCVRIEKRLHRICIRLGYKMPLFYPQSYMHAIMRDMLHHGELGRIDPPWPDLAPDDEKDGTGTVRYVLMHRVITTESQVLDSVRSAIKTYHLPKETTSAPLNGSGLRRATRLSTPCRCGATPSLPYRYRASMPRAMRNRERRTMRSQWRKQPAASTFICQASDSGANESGRRPQRRPHPQASRRSIERGFPTPGHRTRKAPAYVAFAHHNGRTPVPPNSLKNRSRKCDA